MGKNRYRNKKALPAPIRTPVNKCIDETLNNGVDKTDMEENEVDYFSEDDCQLPRPIKGSRLAAGPGSANVAPKRSPSFEIREYTLMPPHRRVIDKTRH